MSQNTAKASPVCEAWRRRRRRRAGATARTQATATARYKAYGHAEPVGQPWPPIDGGVGPDEPDEGEFELIGDDDLGAADLGPAGPNASDPDAGSGRMRKNNPRRAGATPGDDDPGTIRARIRQLARSCSGPNGGNWMSRPRMNCGTADQS